MNWEVRVSGRREMNEDTALSEFNWASQVGKRASIEQSHRFFCLMLFALT